MKKTRKTRTNGKIEEMLIQPTPTGKKCSRRQIAKLAKRPFGFFAIEERDPMIALANSAPASFT